MSSNKAHTIKLFEHSFPSEYTTKYPKLCEIADQIDHDESINQLWRCCNVMAVDRLKINDHGMGHIRLVIQYAFQVFDLLVKAKIEPNSVIDYGLSHEEALVIILLSGCFHDIGHVISRKDHTYHSMTIAHNHILRLIKQHYSDADQMTILSETLHAIYCHNYDVTGMTIEAGILRLADALDMKKGRSSEAIKMGKVDIHSLSTNAVQSVSIQAGHEHPIHIDIEMTSSAGIFQIDSLLKPKLQGSEISPYVSLYAKIIGKSPVKEYRINI